MKGQNEAAALEVYEIKETKKGGFNPPENNIMKKLFVTGANGQLGRAVSARYGGNTDIEIIGTDVDELDITNVDAVVRMVKEVQPYAIINCAAHTRVDACETDVDNAYKINAVGPRNLSVAAEMTGAKMVQISTDYIFAGDAAEPYIEFDTPDPQGVYGRTKYVGEQFVKEFSRKHFIIRTAWLYGDGNNFAKTMLKLAESHDEVTVVDDQIGSPTSTRVLTDIIDRLLWTDNYGVFHGTCEGQCSWAEFAEEIFRLAGKTTRVRHVTTEEYNAAAKRPAYSVLENYMLKLTTDYIADDWKTAIEEYIRSLI